MVARLALTLEARQHGMMKLYPQITSALLPLVDLVFPPRCPLCGEGLASQSGLCGECWSQLAIPTEPACGCCQRPFGEGSVQTGAICAPCIVSPPLHDGVAAGTLYNDASRQLVLSFKHGRKIALAPMLARVIAARLPELEGDWLVIPVPLHRGRIWRRGFNQAALLASELAKNIEGAVLMVDGLIRHKRTPSLGGLGRKARARALSGSIRVNQACRTSLKDAQILLVDDVLTSGVTSHACVSVLKRAGAAKVKIVCFARVLDEALDVAT